MSAAVATADPAFMANLPPLPDIASTDIARRVVTHPSLNGEPTQSFEFPENMAQDYRRDALLGDSLLKGFLTELLYERFPRLTPGAATVILSASWSNATLASDVKAALFEARLYGLHLDTGRRSYDDLKTFIHALFTPLLAQQREAFADSNQTIVAAADEFVDWVSRLNIWCQRRGSRNEYWGPAHAPEFTVSVMVNGVVQGAGGGASMKAAKQEAAAIAVASLLAN